MSQASNIKDAKILVIEDMEFNRLVVTEILAAYGFKNFILAEDGEEGLKKTYESQPDIVILDIMMPKMNGYNYCAKVRKDPQFSDMPIIVQTALSNPEQKVKAFESGATDLINKPINPKEFISRVLVHLENRFMVRDLKMYRERVENELKAAKHMQALLMPKPELISKIKSNLKINIEHYVESSSELGGDFWGVRPLQNGQLAFYMTDFSGHGVTAALNTFRLHTIMEEMIDSDPGRYLEALNQRLYALLARGDFATMLYGIIDTKKKTVRYASAGTTDPIIVVHGADNIEMISGAGFQLGVIADAKYETREFNFSPDDILIVYSDALVEVCNQKGELFGNERLVDFINVVLKINKGRVSAADLLKDILRTFREYSGGVLQDDLTVNVYSYTE